MTEARLDFQPIEPVKTAGLDDQFGKEMAGGQDVAGLRVDDGQNTASPGVASVQDEGQAVTVSEAAEMLGITRRSALRLVQEGKLAGAKGDQGQWFVKLASVQDRLELKSQTGVGFEQVAVEVADGHDHGWSGGQVEGQLEIIKSLVGKLEALTYKNGYLESQLATANEQVKLLPDLEAQAAKAVTQEAHIRELEAELAQLKSRWFHRLWRRLSGEIKT